MKFWSLLFRRSLSTERRDIGQIFFKEDIQKLLTDITRYDEAKIFSRRPLKKLAAPRMMFMSNEQLERAKSFAYQEVSTRMQMPPLLAPDNSTPKVISRDEELVGYTKFRIMFVDISPGYTNRTRLMSVREPDGSLRYPTHSERSRLNNIFFTRQYVSIDAPKLFEEENLSRLLKAKEYHFILNKACLQFEPDDPRYCEVTSRVYSFVDDKCHFDELRSTRHFGPMSLFLAYNKRVDNLLLEMLSKKLVDDAAKLVMIYNTCHNIEYEENEDPLSLIKKFADTQSNKKHNFDLALQDLENKQSHEDDQEPIDNNEETK